MTAPMTFLRLAALTAALMAVQSAERPARACDDTNAALQAQPAPADGAEKRRFAQLQQDAADNLDLVTGDGQQGSAPAKPIVCAAPDTGCTP